jgi:hypothetical protein
MTGPSPERWTPITLAPESDQPLWDRQPGESTKMHSYFTDYRNRGRARRIRELAADLGRGPNYMEQTARKFHWTRRARAWDAYQDQLFLDRLADEQRRMVDRHLKVSKAMWGKLVQRIATLDPAELTPAESIRWLEVLTKVDRAALGAPDTTITISDQRNTEPMPIPASEEVRQHQLKELMAEITRRYNDGDEDALFDIDGGAAA